MPSKVFTPEQLEKRRARDRARYRRKRAAKGTAAKPRTPWSEERRAAMREYQRRRRVKQALRYQHNTTRKTHDWHGDDSARADLARRNHIRAVVESTEQASTFDPAMVAGLAAREHYAEACAILTSKIGWPGGNPYSPQVILWATNDESLLAFRFAHAFGLIDTKDGTGFRVHRGWLQDRAPDCEPSRVALALMGEVPDWATAGPRERAGLILHTVVEARKR